MEAVGGAAYAGKQMEIELQSLLVQNEREAHEAEDLFDVVKTVKEKISIE